MSQDKSNQQAIDAFERSLEKVEKIVDSLRNVDADNIKGKHVYSIDHALMQLKTLGESLK